MRAAIGTIEALAARATDSTEKKDLTTLATVLDEAAMNGKTFADWNSSYEAFFVKYAGQCGVPVAS